MDLVGERGDPLSVDLRLPRCPHCDGQFSLLLHCHRLPVEGELWCDDCHMRITSGLAWRRHPDQRPMCDDCYFEFGEYEEVEQYGVEYYVARHNLQNGVVWD